MLEYNEYILMTDIPSPWKPSNELLQQAIQLLAIQITDNLDNPQGRPVKITWKAEILSQ